ncbi:MAG: hypothetical protein HUK20_12210, partial [Fibrobacter sp.]|nr:hypothetical protein [Fibrobacter sp.]
KVHVDVLHCDITVKGMPKPAEIKKILFEQVKTYCSREKISPKDIIKVVHLVDTDGAFVPNDAVEENASTKNVIYEQNKIIAKSKKSIESRNKCKSDILKRLSTMPLLNNMDYCIYYLSRNLEHVLHNRADDVSDIEKKMLSEKFDDEFADDLDGFLEFIKDEAFAVPCNYRESWEFIGQGCNSLKRYSNLHLLFK